MSTVPEIRASLTPFQKNLLEEIVEVFWSTTAGPVAVGLHLKYKNKRKVIDALNSMGGSVVFEMEDWNTGHRYHPTFLGILLSSRGKKCEKLLADYVDWLEGVVLKNHKKTEVTSREVIAGMGLRLEKANELYRLMGLTNLCGRSHSGGGPDGHWNARVFEGIDDLSEWQDRKEYIRHLAMLGYEAAKPVLVEDRRRQQSQYSMPLSGLFEQAAPVSVAEVGGTEIDVFLSHASKDRDLAEALIALLQKALGLEKERIRCTSVPGFKLATGVDTDEEIRKEVLGSRVLIGLLTPMSLGSSYVLFELGARWGRGLFLAPLFAKGASGGFLRGPISGFNALPADQETDLKQFLRDVSKASDLKVADAKNYETELAEVMRISTEGDLFNRYESKRVKGRGERKRDQYFVSQRKSHYLNQDAAAVCDQAKIELIEVDAAEEAWLLLSAGVDLNAEQTKAMLRALKLWTSPAPAITVIPRKRRNSFDGLI